MFTMVAQTTHGMTDSPEFSIWSSMIKRCRYPSTTRWDRYGGRGISVCDRWRNSFQNFYEDMGPRPSKDHSVERRENDGNYEPNNCYWATRVEQQNNRSVTVKIPHPDTGELMTIRAIYQQYLKERTKTEPVPEIPLHVFQQRIDRGWTIEEAAETSLVLPTFHDYKGEKRSIADIARMNDIEPYNLRHHVRENGYSVEEALELLLHGAVPVRKHTNSRVKVYEYQDQHYTLSGLASFSNIKKSILADRLHSGMTVEQALTQPIRGENTYRYKGGDYNLNQLLAMTGMSRSSFFRYQKLGVSAEQAVELYLKKTSS